MLKCQCGCVLGETITPPERTSERSNVRKIERIGNPLVVVTAWRCDRARSFVPHHSFSTALIVNARLLLGDALREHERFGLGKSLFFILQPQTDQCTNQDSTVRIMREGRKARRTDNDKASSVAHSGPGKPIVLHLSLASSSFFAAPSFIPIFF